MELDVDATPAFGPVPMAAWDAAAPWLPDELPPLPPEPPVVAVEASPADEEEVRAARGEAVARARAAWAAAAAEGPARRRAELEATVAAARAEAYAEGLTAGREDERARLASAVQAADAVLQALREADAPLRGRLEENVCALAVGIARQLVERELKVDPTFVTSLVRQALVEFPLDQPVSIRINPVDLAAITALSLVEEGAPGITAGREARWVADPEIAPGGCMVEGPDRIVDGRVDTALERVYRRLAQVTQ